MIIKKIVPFIKNEPQHVSHDRHFDIIDAELNKPEFGKVTLYLNVPTEVESALGLSHRNYALCYTDEKLHGVLETQYWEIKSRMKDSASKTVFLMIPTYHHKTLH